jgi:hypothetical protein
MNKPKMVKKVSYALYDKATLDGLIERLIETFERTKAAQRVAALQLVDFLQHNEGGVE